MADRGGFISEADRQRLDAFPAEIEDPAVYFTLLPEDIEMLRSRRDAAGRLAGGLQIGALRLLGFVPADLAGAPAFVVEFLAEQLGVDASSLGEYSSRDQTRSDHVAVVERHLGFRRADRGELKALGDWLVERALEHDRPSTLFAMACEHLRGERIVRPGVTVVERAVLAARQRATQETYLRLAPQLDADRREQLMSLLDVDPDTGVTPWTWIRRQAPTAAPAAIKEQIAKIGLLRRVGADRLDLGVLNPNRVRHLAAVGNRMTNQAVGRLAPERRYQVLAATVVSALIDRTDEVLDLFDIAIAGVERSARTEHADARANATDAAVATVRVFNQIAEVLVDPDVEDHEVRSAIFDRVSVERFETTMRRAAGIDLDGVDNHLGYITRRFTQLRKFAPAVLAAFSFHTSNDDLAAALALLDDLNESGTRLVPGDAPIDFASRRWQQHIIGDDGRIDRHAWEAALLVELRASLRAADVWVDHSRRYRNPTDYLLPPARWHRLRGDFMASTGLTLDVDKRVDQLGDDLNAHLVELDQVLDDAEAARIEDGQLIVSPLSAEAPPDGTEELRDEIADLMPRIDLVDLLVEVDSWTNFRTTLTHADNATRRSTNHPERLLAALVAHGCNFGIDTMARIAGFTADELAWTNTWHLRTDTVRAANDTIVNHQTALPLAARWGSGTLSSSDGQRFPVTVNTPRARHHRKYFTGTGATIYTWTSDRHAQYGTRVIPTTVREATYVLDAIFDNETDLEIEEHTTDTAGYTDLVFGLFDLCGLRFSPRIRDLADQRLWRLQTTATGTPAAELLRHPIRTDRFVERWDDMLRVAATIRHGYLPASTLVARLQGSARQNKLTQAIQEYGRIIKTISILRYLNNPTHRRRVLVQLNKGEALHGLRKVVFFANSGEIRRRNTGDQDLQGESLTLITNAIVCWNTVYIDAAIAHLRNTGRQITDDQIRRLSPASHEHINRYGRYDFHTPSPPDPGQLRPLRT